MQRGIKSMAKPRLSELLAILRSAIEDSTQLSCVGNWAVDANFPGAGLIREFATANVSVPASVALPVAPVVLATGTDWSIQFHPATTAEYPCVRLHSPNRLLCPGEDAGGTRSILLPVCSTLTDGEVRAGLHGIRINAMGRVLFSPAAIGGVTIVPLTGHVRNGRLDIHHGPFETLQSLAQHIEG